MLGLETVAALIAKDGLAILAPIAVLLADEWVSIGSCNFDHWNLHWNLEANQEVMDPKLAAFAGLLVDLPCMCRPSAYTISTTESRAIHGAHINHQLALIG